MTKHGASTDAGAPLPAWLTMTLRIVGAIVGSYALVALAVASCGAALAHAGMARAEAVALCAMLGFVLYLVLALWAFCVRSVTRLWLALVVVAALLWALWQAVV